MLEPGMASSDEAITIITQLRPMTVAQAHPTGIVGSDDNTDSAIPLDPAHRSRIFQTPPHACRSGLHPHGV